MTDLVLRPSTGGVTGSTDFQQLYSAHAPWLFRVLERLGARSATLEDLVHDVFVAAWKSWARVDLTRPMKPWLFGIAYRVMLDHHRLRSTHSEAPSAAPPERADEGPGPADALARRQGLTLAARIISGLELDRRTVFVMHEVEELTMPEIAEALDVPLNTAYSRLRLARRDFAQAAATMEVRDGN